MRAPICPKRAAADAARMLVDDWNEGGAAGAGEVCDVEAHGAVLICNPDAVGASIGTLGEAEAHMLAAFRKELDESGFAAAGIKSRGLQGTALLQLEVVWVVDKDGAHDVASGSREAALQGAATCGSASCIVEAGDLKSRIWRLAARHHALRSVCITGIPMKDGKGEAGAGADADKSPSAHKKEYTVELLCSAGAEGSTDLVLEWKKNKELEKLDFYIHAFASSRVHRGAALNLQEEATTTLLKFIRQGKPATLVQAHDASPGRLPRAVWVLRCCDQSGTIFLHHLLLDALLDRAPLDESLERFSCSLRPEASDPESAKAYSTRFGELLHGARLILSEQERKEAFSRELDIPHRLEDVLMPARSRGVAGSEGDEFAAGGSGKVDGAGKGKSAAGGYLMMASVERRSRYLPLGLGVSALYSGSTALERATRASAQSNMHLNQDVGGVLQSRGGAMMAPKKEKIRGLREFAETCLSFSVPDETATVAMKTAATVRDNMVKAEKAMVVNGWGHYELQALWKEMLDLGTACGDSEYPTSRSHERLYKQMVELNAGGAGCVNTEEADAKVGDKRKGGVGPVGDGKESKVPRARRAHDIPLDANGRPRMPLHLGSAMTIWSLGTVKVVSLSPLHLYLSIYVSPPLAPYP